MNTPGSLRRLAVMGVLAWMILIFALSSRSTFPTTGGLPANVAAIIGHLVAYAVLAALIRLAIRGFEPDFRADLISIALATLYGLSDEFHQSFVPGRDASAFDVLVDIAGASLGVTITNLMGSFWRRPGRES